MADGSTLEIETSIMLLEALHQRWTDYLDSIQEETLERTYYHPEEKRAFSIKEATGLYAWHGQHLLAQIEIAKQLKIAP